MICNNGNIHKLKVVAHKNSRMGCDGHMLVTRVNNVCWPAANYRRLTCFGGGSWPAASLARRQECAG